MSLLLAGFLTQVAAPRPLYLAIFCGLSLLSVALVLLARSRWGQSHPLQRCAVLSLLVHLVLACLAMTVRQVVGDGGAGAGPPIQVRLVDDPVVEFPLAMVTPPPLLDAEPPEPITEPKADDLADALPVAPDQPDLATNDTEPMVEPPPLFEPAEADVDETTDAQDVPPTTTDAELVDPSPESASRSPAAVAEHDAATPDHPSTDVAAPAVPTPYARRLAADRLRWAEGQGGSRQTEAAVAAALKWLADAQSSDGRWDASRFGAGAEMAVLGQNRGGAGADADAGISALALLAFLGAGNTHQDGEYRPVVRRGIEFLVGSQAANGNLASRTGLFAQMYCHSMATYALAEALAMTGDPWLEPAVRRAVSYSVRAQNTSTGGWRYKPGETGDTSQLGWQLMALWSADRAGIDVPPQTWTGAERFLRSVRRGRYGGQASYLPYGPASTPMTAEAFYCRQLVEEMIGGSADRNAAAEATRQLLAARPDATRFNLYYWYYATLALHHQHQTSEAAIEAWQKWNTALTTTLLDAQVADGPEAGSWHPTTVWGGYGGRVYTTSVAALSLEVYYRYAPSPTDDPWMATRPQVRLLPQR